jgi:hypothetical protein
MCDSSEVRTTSTYKILKLLPYQAVEAYSDVRRRPLHPGGMLVLISVKG